MLNQVMLVLTTMFVGISQTLPHTSTIKMVDVWLVFNLLIPFIEVLIHSYKVFFLNIKQPLQVMAPTVCLLKCLPACLPACQGQTYGRTHNILTPWALTENEFLGIFTRRWSRNERSHWKQSFAGMYCSTVYCIDYWSWKAWKIMNAGFILGKHKKETWQRKGNCWEMVWRRNTAQNFCR